jgi:hypothetical protein
MAEVRGSRTDSAHQVAFGKQNFSSILLEIRLDSSRRCQSVRMILGPETGGRACSMLFFVIVPDQDRVRAPRISQAA